MNGDILFKQFSDQLKHEINAGKYPIGSILPSIAKLHTESGLSRNTVIAALNILLEEGIIQRVGASRYGYKVIKTTHTIEENTSNSTKLPIVLIMPFNYHNYIGSQLLQAIESVITTNFNTNLIIRNNENSIEREREILASLLENDLNSISGIIVMAVDSFKNPNCHLIEKISHIVPVIFLDRYIVGMKNSYVGLNNREVGYEAAKHFIDKGHKKLGFITGFNRLSPMIDRMMGFIETAERHGISVQEKHIFSTPQEFQIINKNNDLTELLKSKLDLSEDGPTAYFCGEDKSAITLYQILTENGKKVPQDISIIGCNNDGFVHAVSKNPLCSFSHPFTAIAQEVLRKLEAEIDNNQQPKIRTEFFAQFTNHSSTLSTLKS